MQPDYYPQYFRFEREHWYFLARNNIIMARLRSMLAESALVTAARRAVKPLRILNVGVATGRTSELLAEFGEVVSVEYDRECFEFVSDVLEGQVVINGSITELPFDADSFDVVCAFDVIEHVDDDVTAAKELMRVCKPSGLVYVSVPAFQFMWGKHDEINMHKRRYTLPQFSGLFDGQGEFVFRTYFNFWLFPLVATARVAGRVLNRFGFGGSGSDFDLAGSNGKTSIFYRIFDSERHLLKRFRLPVGVSVLLAWRKSR